MDEDLLDSSLDRDDGSMFMPHIARADLQKGQKPEQRTAFDEGVNDSTNEGWLDN
jgi:hypothetical protein